MTAFELVQRWPGSRTVAVITGGAIIGVLAVALLNWAGPLYLVLLLAGLMAIVGSLAVPHAHLYWLTLFLVSLQFDVKKNLGDGFAVRETLGIGLDTTLYVFVPEVRAADLVLGMLVAIWLTKTIAKRTPVYWPRQATAATIWLGWLALTVFISETPYLGLMELFRHVKFFIVFLYAVNCLGSKESLRTITIVLLVSLCCQAALTLVRFQSGWLEPIGFGEDFTDPEARLRYLQVDDSIQMSRGFGTFTSPASTTQFCLLILPLAYFGWIANTGLIPRWLAGLAYLFGSFGLLFTFSKNFLLGYTAQLGVLVLITAYRGYLSRRLVVRMATLAPVVILAITPPLLTYMGARPHTLTARFRQYDAAAKMIADHPMMGVGLNNGTTVKPRYHDESYNPGRSDSHANLEPIHSFYISLLAEVGIIGLAVFLALCLIMGQAAWRLSLESPAIDVRMMSTAILASFVGLAGSVGGDVLQDDGVLKLLWLLAGVTVAMHTRAQYETETG